MVEREVYRNVETGTLYVNTGRSADPAYLHVRQWKNGKLFGPTRAIAVTKLVKVEGEESK